MLKARYAAGVLLLATAIGGSVFALVIATRNAPGSPVIADRDVTPVTVKAAVSSTYQRVAADLNLTWRQDPPLLWPGAQGTIRSITDSTLIESGKTVAWVDSEGIIALHTRRPMYRDLKPGSRGTDVADLISELQRLKLLGTLDHPDRYVREVSVAVRSLNELRGVNSNALLVETVLWLPNPSVQASSAIAVGERAPAAGAATFVSPWYVVSAEVVETLPDGTTTKLRPSSSPRQLILDGLRFDLDGRGRIHDTSRLTTKYSSDDTEVKGGAVELVTPETLHQLPASAIVAGSEGQTCVYSADGIAHEVNVVEGRAGVVRTAERVHGDIVANPIAAGFGTSCGG